MVKCSFKDKMFSMDYYFRSMQVSVLGGRPSAAKKDWMNTRVALTLTSHVIFA